MPALCSLLLGGNISEKDNFFMRWAKAAYAPLLGIAWKTRWGVVGGVVALLAVTVALFMSLKQEFVPTLNEGSWTAMVYQPANTSLTTSLNRCIKTQKYLINKVPEVTRTFARVGTCEVATDPM